jgi:cytochrome P450
MAFFALLKESFQASLLYVSIFLVVLLWYFLKLKSEKRKSNLPPNPPKLPIIGNLHQLGNMPHLSFQCLAERFGPIIYLQLGEIPTVVVSSARLAKEVMKTHDLALSNRPQTFSAKHLLYNCTNVLFSPYGAYWRHIRKICINELLSAKMVQSYSFVREEEVARLVHGVANSYPKTTNLTRLLGLYANDVICRVAFGRDFSAGGEYDRHGFQKTLEEFHVLLGGISIGDFFPSMEFIHNFTGMKSRLQNIFGRYDKLFDQLLAEHQNPKRDKVEHKDLIDVLLDIQKNDSDEIPLTTDNIKAIILVSVHFLFHFPHCYKLPTYKLLLNI